MKKAAIILILIVFSLPDYCQTIFGTVTDNDTRKPISGASVFLNGTTIGTYTDEAGNFRLTLPDNQKLPLAVSSIGYFSVLGTDYTTEYPLKIFMKPKVYELNEVHVYSKMTSRDKSARKKYLNQFREQFLGKTTNARRCEILNEKDLALSYTDDQDTLKAYSHKPLIINNKALGYQIIFYLEKFEYAPNSLSLVYLGNHIFMEDRTLKGLKRKIVEKRRRLAYIGSRMQFFRSLWENKLDSAGFTVKNKSNEILTYDSLVVETDASHKYLKYKGTTKVSYYSKMYGTTMEILYDSVSFDKLGYFYPLGINWLGEMVDQRIGDLLPFDYKFK